MALEWSDALVLFSNNAVAGSDRRSVRTGAGRGQRQDLAPGRHARSCSCGMTQPLGRLSRIQQSPKICIQPLVVIIVLD